MAPANKAVDGPRKPGSAPALVVKLRVSPGGLRSIVAPEPVEAESLPREATESKGSPNTPVAPATTSNSNADNASESNAPTPAPEGTPVDSSTGQSADGSKKKGVKRSAAAASEGTEAVSKPKGKPGPKKKPRLEDGTIDHSTAANRTAGGHKLGPKANQGAINAGLRALDRSGKPCRRWAKGGFKLKSFTGVVWDISRWTAPPKKGPDTITQDSTAVSGDNSSSKENKENGQEVNSASNSNSGVDVEARSAVSINASSPAPTNIAAIA